MKKHAIPIAVLLVVVLALCGSASAASTGDNSTVLNTTPITSNNLVYINVSNDNGVKYNLDSAYYSVYNNGQYAINGTNGTYFIRALGGGLNQLHISNSNSTSAVNGQVNVISATSTSSSGVFYITTTGGRGFNDDIILLLSVKGPISNDFSVTIVSSGYGNWTIPVGGAYQPSLPTDYKYITGAINETFTSTDFLYGPQTQRPAPSGWQTLYNGQDTSDNSTAEYLMFIDLYVGNIMNTKIANMIDNGAVKVEYTFNNLNTTASFNAYAWAVASYQDEGINWCNPTSSSVVTVNYTPVTPVAAFSANTTSGNSPLNVQFTDNSSNYPTSWLWDFGDETTSTEQNPTHTYTKPGNYTVTLTAINAAGNSTYTMNITALDVTAPTVSASPVGGSFNTTQTVTLNTTDDSGSATTYYTTDGTNPKTSTTRSVYNGPITINGTTTLLFAAVDAASNWSPVYNETYQIKSDVYVNITPSNSNPQVGDTVTYKFKLGNNGPGIAKDVIFTYTIPEGLEYAGATVDQGTVTYNATTRTITWNLGDVAVGDPNLWLNLKVLTAGNYNIQPTVTVGGTTLESNINSLQVNAASATTKDPKTVNAATTTQTIPMKTTGMPITALISALILIGSGIAINRKK